MSVEGQNFNCFERVIGRTEKRERGADIRDEEIADDGLGASKIIIPCVFLEREGERFRPLEMRLRRRRRRSNIWKIPIMHPICFFRLL